MLFNLEIKLRNVLEQFFLHFKKNGFECYMVGGAVRDLILNKKINDIDFATNASPYEVQKIFPRTIATGIKHGTVTVLVDKYAFEVTTYRQEGKYTDARKPDNVNFKCNIYEDIGRRDFTINSLAYDLLTDTILDLYNGQNDIKNKIIKTVGDPQKRFFEDGLRPIRACRFRATLEFEFEEQTKKALSKPEILERVALVARERFTDELFKGFRSKKISLMLEALEENKLLYIFTSKSQSEIKTPKIILETLDNIFPSPITLRLAYWRFGLNLKEDKDLEEWEKNINISNKIFKEISYYIKYFNFQNEVKNHIIEKNNFLLNYFSLKNFREDNILMFIIRTFLSKIKKAFETETQKFLEGAENYTENIIPINILIELLNENFLVIKDLKIDGNDLRKFGLSGKELGNCLTFLINEVLKDQDKNEKEKLLELGLEYSKKKLITY